MYYGIYIYYTFYDTIIEFKLQNIKNEITKHLHKLRNKKANNDIDSELLKKCECPILLDFIHQMTTNVWENFDIPTAWGNS